ncbi:glycoside hydrolase family 9 protein [Shewanella sp. 1_MG-2023]|uniref:glycoside hydrolase family 9 protein n=1 Tax=unclassified Shewanella TaxID=196818 RepID=UPI0026E3E9B4|nr:MULTISPECIES: glycoside hydrolase family 9 protein [unclassified Shewanella]MDO6611533.1 glycoside hydrolase family 9 protein [Shewanella sp. 7_MG-2023]MDO6771388.1 glycoside hydrolase family 9 protein [Shewanella sp. 2_MG-2023]MDO6793614.1 glycoside hydrolase family 9 protein [Shewanella sp. 1_MG-2023]
MNNLISNKTKQWISPFKRSASLLACMSITVLVSHSSVADEQDIRFNQLGFGVNAAKTAVVSNTASENFSLIEQTSGKTVYQGKLSAAKAWAPSAETVKLAQFDDFTQAGEYQLKVDSLATSHPFSISESRYNQPLKTAMRAYFYNRSGAVIQQEYAGIYARPAAHPDTIVYIHKSAASKTRPEGTVISSPKGWYDAGDYNKYIVNSNITVYTLLSALAEQTDVLSNLSLNIPESSNNLPDTLDEILWNMDWMLTMQDPADGGLYHKLTTKRFTGEDEMPHMMDQPRYIIAKSTAATLGFAATMAKASQILAQYDANLPVTSFDNTSYSQQLLRAAKYAWQWAIKNPDIHYQQPDDIHTGAYATAGDNLKDEWLWAAAELFAATGEDEYLNTIELPKQLRIPEWDKVETLALITIATTNKSPQKLKQQAQSQLLKLTDNWTKVGEDSAYGLAISEQDFVWGSNSNMLNKAVTLHRVSQLLSTTEQQDSLYNKHAEAIVDYIFGRNPLGMSFVTGVGLMSPMNVHHRASMADGIKAPIPGFLAGGPQPGQQDAGDCKKQGGIYPSKHPAKSYIDHGCSYASNEVAINWNAPLVYMLAALSQ